MHRAVPAAPAGKLRHSAAPGTPSPRRAHRGEKGGPHLLPRVRRVLANPVHSLRQPQPCSSAA